MRRPLRRALVVVGLAAVVYGTASLTGGWLRTPPWWEREGTEEWAQDGRRAWVVKEEARLRKEGILAADGVFLSDYRGPAPVEPRPGREWISGGVVALGLGLAAVGAWPRRRLPAPAP